MMEDRFQGTYFGYSIYVLLVPKGEENYIFVMRDEEHPKKIVHFILTQEQKTALDELKTQNSFKLKTDIQESVLEIMNKAVSILETAIYQEIKTAYELFDELGFYQEVWEEREERHILYRRDKTSVPNSKMDDRAWIDFYNDGQYEVWDNTMLHENIKIKPEIHKAITKQLEEFGWL